MTRKPDTEAVTRRAVIAGTGLGIAALAGCTGGSGASGSDGGGDDAGAPDFDGWLSDATGYEGVVDRTGRATVTVGVGGDRLAFDPAAVRVDAGTTVRWEWVGDGSAHNVAAADDAFQSDYHTEADASYERTFEEPGVVKYLCVPHEYAGMKGVVVVGDAA